MVPPSAPPQGLSSVLPAMSILTPALIWLSNTIKSVVLRYEVNVLKRVTGDVITDYLSKKRKCGRHNVGPNQPGTIHSYDAPTQNHLLVRFDIDGETVQASVHVDNLALQDAAAKTKDLTGKPSTLGKKYTFLTDKEDEQITIFDKWDKSDCTSAKFQIHARVPYTARLHRWPLKPLCRSQTNFMGYVSLPTKATPL